MENPIDMGGKRNLFAAAIGGRRNGESRVGGRKKTDRDLGGKWKECRIGGGGSNVLRELFFIFIFEIL